MDIDALLDGISVVDSTGRPLYYTLDEDRNPVPATNYREWADWELAHKDEPRLLDPEGMDDCRVGSTHIGEAWVSTVFTGRAAGQHGPPILFETRIFGGEHNDSHERCATWAEAEVLHAHFCAVARGEIPDDD